MKLKTYLLDNGYPLALKFFKNYIIVYYGDGEMIRFKNKVELRNWIRLKFNQESPC